MAALGKATGFFRRGGRIIPIFKKSATAKAIKARHGLSKAKHLVKKRKQKVLVHSGEERRLSELAREQKDKLRAKFPNERVSGGTEGMAARELMKKRKAEAALDKSDALLKKKKEKAKSAFAAAAKELSVVGGGAGLLALASTVTFKLQEDR